MSHSTAHALRRFARAWARAIVPIGFVPMSAAELDRRLLALSRSLANAVLAERFVARPGYDAGVALVASHLTDPAVLDATLTVMRAELPAALAANGIGAEELADRVAGLEAALAAGYARALRDTTMAEQERLGRAIVDANASIEKALRDSEARFRAIFAGAAIGIGIADMDGRILQVNSAFADLLGYRVDEMCRLNVTDLTHPDDPPSMWQLYADMVSGARDHVRLDKAYFRKDGGVVWTDLSVSLIRDEAGEPSFTVAMVEDVTDRRMLEQRLRHQALHDPLTGLPNRTLFTDRLAEIFAERAPDARVGLCYLDLDGFKRVNDTLGHDIGDQLLAAVARRLDERLSGPGRLLARMGGDEFVLLVEPSPGAEQVAELAQATLDAVSRPFWVDRHRLRVSVSIGVVDRRVDQTSPADLLKAADVTLYRAKSDGRGRWAMYDAERSAREVARYELAAALPDALDRGDFTLAYQPIVSLDDGAIRGVEALLRWRHPRLGLLLPDEFVALAEETGLIVPLGRWVLETACRQAAAWSEDLPGSEMFVSVNIAAGQAQEPTFVDDVVATLDQTGLDPALLQLELTESAIMDTNGAPLDAMHTLTARGVRTAIDDFGTGYSNLAYLGRLPVQTLKLAGSFIDGLRDADRVDLVHEEIVNTIVRLAHALGLTVTVEGIETQSQADQLRALRCDTAQGWLFARPQSAEEMTALLRSARPDRSTRAVGSRP
jgi:diguanylate cyclase (GGDEF)-like protein/PAS domain S-box-containing protein